MCSGEFWSERRGPLSTTHKLSEQVPGSLGIWVQCGRVMGSVTGTSHLWTLTPPIPNPSVRPGAAQPGHKAADGRDHRRACRDQSRNDHPHGGSECGFRGKVNGIPG